MPLDPLRSGLHGLPFALLFAAAFAQQHACTPLNVSVAAPIFTTAPFFASWNLDSSRQRLFFDLNFSDPRLLYLASQIGGGRIRFGGTGNNYLFYGVGADAGACPPTVPFRAECLNATLLDALLAVSATARAPLLFGLNLQPVGGGPPGAPFNASNARALMGYLHAKAPGAVAAFELGNELEGKVSAAEAAAAFLALDAVAAEVWAGGAARPALVGPDANGSPAARAAYLASFSAAAGGRIDALTYHEYIGASADNVLNGTFLDRTADNAATSLAIIRAANATINVFAGEIGPHTGDGANSSFAHCSNNRLCGRFGSTLWYADAMGASARAGVAAFFRQDLVGADYALVNTSAPGGGGASMTGGFTPSPDYYFLAVWQRLVGARVLDAGVANARQGVRVYAFCARAPSGGVAVLAINLEGEGRCVWWAAFEGAAVEAYAFTAGDGAGVESYGARLNGRLLALDGGGRLPSLSGAPAEVINASVALPPQSATLFYVPGAAPVACA